jgi:pimeloyl-ACP methyl ester carboxylesterase
MIVKTLGSKENPAILLIPCMFCTSEMTGLIGRYFEEDYYVILPTLDGHHKEVPEYVSKEEDARKIAAWLHENGIRQLKLLQGTSMGAEVALELASKLDLPVEHSFYDGGPFFHFPRPLRWIMARKFMMFMNKVKGKDKVTAAEDLLKDPFVKKLGGESLESYRGMMNGFCEVGQWIDWKSVRRISDTCYKCDLPDLDAGKVRKSVFFFSENEPARKSEKRLKKKYPEAVFDVGIGYGHCGFQITDPDAYAGYIRKMIGS